MTPRLLRCEAKYVQRNVWQLEQEGQHPLTGQRAGYWPFLLFGNYYCILLIDLYVLTTTTNAAADVGVELSTASPNVTLTDVADVVNATLTNVSKSRTSCMKQVSK